MLFNKISQLAIINERPVSKLTNQNDHFLDGCSMNDFSTSDSSSDSSSDSEWELDRIVKKYKYEKEKDKRDVVTLDFTQICDDSIDIKLNYLDEDVIQTGYSAQLRNKRVTSIRKVKTLPTRSNITSNPYTSVQWSPDGGALAVTTDSGELCVIDNNIYRHYWKKKYGFQNVKKSPYLETNGSLINQDENQDEEEDEDINIKTSVNSLRRFDGSPVVAWYPRSHADISGSSLLGVAARHHHVMLIDAVTGKTRATYFSYDNDQNPASPHSLAFNRVNNAGSHSNLLVAGYKNMLRVFDIERDGSGPITQIITSSQRVLGYRKYCEYLDMQNQLSDLSMQNSGNVTQSPSYKRVNGLLEGFVNRVTRSKYSYGYGDIYGFDRNVFSVYYEGGVGGNGYDDDDEEVNVMSKSRMQLPRKRDRTKMNNIVSCLDNQSHFSFNSNNSKTSSSHSHSSSQLSQSKPHSSIPSSAPSNSSHPDLWLAGTFREEIGLFDMRIGSLVHAFYQSPHHSSQYNCPEIRQYDNSLNNYPDAHVEGITGENPQKMGNIEKSLKNANNYVFRPNTTVEGVTCVRWCGIANTGEFRNHMTSRYSDGLAKSDLSFTPLESAFVAGFRKKNGLQYWELRQPKAPVCSFDHIVENNQRMNFDVDSTGQYIAVGSQKGDFTLWNLNNLSLVKHEHTIENYYKDLNMDDKADKEYIHSYYTSKPEFHSENIHPNTSVCGISLHPMFSQGIPIVASVGGTRTFQFDDDEEIDNSIKVWNLL